MTSIYLPSSGPHDWQWLLAKPGLHWKHGASAMGLADDDCVAGIRYQLLHRTASAVIEARRFGATHAVMLVHSFSPNDAWLEDFLDFASLCGAAQLAKGVVAPVREIGAITLHLGW